MCASVKPVYFYEKCYPALLFLSVRLFFLSLTAMGTTIDHMKGFIQFVSMQIVSWLHVIWWPMVMWRVTIWLCICLRFRVLWMRQLPDDNRSLTSSRHRIIYNSYNYPGGQESGLYSEFNECRSPLLSSQLPNAPPWLFRYIPTEWLETSTELTPKGQDEVNKINMELVHQLKANDSAFSLGRTPGGLACTRFGLITNETDMEELLGLVYTTGKEIEESSKVGVSVPRYLSHT